MSMPKILVTGGRGVLGREVVPRLRAAGSEVRVLSRSGGPGTFRGDLATGEGLTEAVSGIETIVHCASSPWRRLWQTDVEGTKRLLEVASRAGVVHLIYISIVGIDRATSYPYYQAKLAAERAIEAASIPYTILRATQFYDLVLQAVRFLDRFPVVLVPDGFPGQAIDTREVAGRLVDLALRERAGRVPDVGGPEVRTFTEAVRSYLDFMQSRKRLVSFRLPGRTARALRAGVLTCPENRYGRLRWEAFLRERLSRGIA